MPSIKKWIQNLSHFFLPQKKNQRGHRTSGIYHQYSKLLALWWIMSSTTSYVLQNIINQQNQVFFYPLQQQQEHNNRQEFFDTVRASCCLYGTVPGKKQTNENTNRTDRKERVIIK